MELTDTINSVTAKTASGQANRRKGGERRKTPGVSKLLAVLCLIFLLPIVTLGIVATMGQSSSLANGRAEMREQAYAADVARLVNAAMAHQNATARWLSGDLAAGEALQRSTAEVNKTLNAVEAAHRTVGNELHTAAQWQQVKNQWKQLSFLDGENMLRAPELHRLLGQALGKLSTTIAARRSELQAMRVRDMQGLVKQARVFGGASVAIALVALVLLGGKVFGSIKQRRTESDDVVEKNKRNEAAILRLMDELSVIASGDLTAQAEVTEEITGAIADSVNVTVSQLRKVVRDINVAADQVSTSTDRAQETSRRLIADAARQAEDIEAADVSVEMMTQSMTEVSQSANESADVALKSLQTTERGSQAVQNSIGGMNEIRQQIQETAKRMKRLGESSQEIGEIVDVITDIAEQTNVLALNAAIQAAAAGEAGRAFAVVAEEVQLLAERSGEATTQIAGLVRTIQSDAQEAAAAMESSIQGVVDGARLSDTAGRSLQEIQTVTRDLAEMIQRIAVNTETQVVVAEEVRKIMRDVLDVTSATTEGTQLATTSVTEVAGQAQSLKSSVAQFKVA
ncbi:MAG: methyl-accepting chemotaxis protein [Betaproteobacteria bacterium]|nr:MAG: methyl-accepting chemotaxis protein [Betaproteobacteria bacterium]